MGLPRYRFLLVLFSGPPDIVPWPEIGTAPLTLSNDTVVNIVHDILLRLLTVSAPPDGKDIKQLVNHPRFIVRPSLHNHRPM